MKLKNIYLVSMLFCIMPAINAQLGIKAGINFANEAKSLSKTNIASAFKTNNLTGYQIGITYQAMPKKSGLGAEIGLLLSQKGSSFIDSTSTTNTVHEGYTEINYLEIPLSIRYRLKLGLMGIYGYGGIYGGYALSRKNVNETSNTIENIPFPGLSDHVDYGLNFGAGIELFNKIQFGIGWSEGLKNTARKTTELPISTVSTNKVFTINLVYML